MPGCTAGLPSLHGSAGSAHGTAHKGPRVTSGPELSALLAFEGS